MKVILTENQLKKIIKEHITDKYDFYDMISNITYDILSSIKHKQKIFFELIRPLEYKRALEEYMKYGQIIRFSENKIQDWKYLVLENIAKLSVLTDINGHSPHFPYDKFYDVFDELEPSNDEKYDFSYVYGLLEDEYDIDEYIPFFSNGQPVLSDYGLNPLLKLAEVLLKETTSEGILLTINRIMNVVHQRSDLSELFIEGGEKSHSMISNT